MSAPGGPKRPARGPAAAQSPLPGLIASLLLVALIATLIAWARC